VRQVAKAVLVLVALYGLAVGILYAAMRRPPDQYSAFMARVPGWAMRGLPFRPLWFWARAGALDVGEAAPDFELNTFDRTGRVRLASFRGQKPVVLVFGSYT
jgi:hypothetical protein